MSDYRAKTKPWYGTARWKRTRERHLASEPLCRYCKQQGITKEARICDHVEPHKGDPDKFWSGPFQSLCKPCHDRHKQREERTGKKAKVYGPDGWPEN